MHPVYRITLLSLLVILFGIQITKADDHSSSPQDDASALPLDELRTFTEVFAKIKNDYVENLQTPVRLRPWYS